jgi:hypothetical protein
MPLPGLVPGWSAWLIAVKLSTMISMIYSGPGASLDRLFWQTRFPHRFVLVDLASEDPLVRRVVSGFERRGMFARLANRSEVEGWAAPFRR